MPDTRTGSYTIAAVPFWRRLGTVGRSPVGLSAAFFVAVVRLGFQVPLVVGVVGGTVLWILAVATYVLIVATIVYAGTVRNPPPVLDFDRSEMRIADDTSAFAEIDSAFVTNYSDPVADLALSVGAPHHRRALFVLRSTKLPTLDEQDRAIVADMLALSGVHIPESKPDPYDPTGRFAWMDHPGHRSKESAIALVRHTPETGI